MRKQYGVIWALWIVALPGSFASADEFDRFDGSALIAVTKGEKGGALGRLTVAELGDLPNVLKGTRAPLVVVKTDQGNACRLLISIAFRKPPGGKGEPLQVIVLERFETFESPQGKIRLARGKDLMLFDGFEVDLDAGLIVPPGQGGDLKFVEKGEGGPLLLALAPAQLFPLKTSPVASPKEPGKPSPGRTIAVEDYDGRYRLLADGKLSGVLELKVNEAGAVSGKFRSDETGGVYEVAGEVAPSRLISFKISFPRVSQSFEGLLWSEGKNAFAGNASLLDRPASFIAIRDGTTIDPEKK